MTNDLIATFLPKFVATARQRITRSLEFATRRDHEIVPAIARELHAIAGEAGLLGIGTIVALARASEDHVKRLRATRSGGDFEVLLASLDDLKNAIELVTPNQKGPHE